MNKNDTEYFLAWLDEYLNFERTPKKNIFWLDTMRFLCEKLGNPQNEIPCFHVAGSKGKGSVSVMIASILKEAGLKTGLYTSPHILSFYERITLSGTEFERSVYKTAATELRQKVNAIPRADFPAGRPLTWFELVTAYAMLCFKNANCDAAVYEVGLGGRLDSTNVINPRCCALCAMELEHTEYLGNTIEEIAAEKAGIIKSGVPVIAAPQQAKVKAVFKEVAKSKGAPITFLDDVVKLSEPFYELNNNIYDVHKNAQNIHKTVHNNTDSCATLRFTMDSPLFSRTMQPRLRLLGDFQILNAALATLVVKTAYPNISEDVIEAGLSSAFLPGRFEITLAQSGGLIVFDGAHTVNSINFTLRTLRTVFPKQTKHLLYASAADKDVEHIASSFKDSFSSVTLTRPGTEKISDLPRLQKAFSLSGISYRLEADCAAALHIALSNISKNDVLLVTGSFYLVSEVKKLLAQK